MRLAEHHVVEPAMRARADHNRSFTFDAHVLLARPAERVSLVHTETGGERENGP
jgi:hypothetical protein